MAPAPTIPRGHIRCKEIFLLTGEAPHLYDNVRAGGAIQNQSEKSLLDATLIHRDLSLEIDPQSHILTKTVCLLYFSHGN